MNARDRHKRNDSRTRKLVKAPDQLLADRSDGPANTFFNDIMSRGGEFAGAQDGGLETFSFCIGKSFRSSDWPGSNRINNTRVRNKPCCPIYHSNAFSTIGGSKRTPALGSFCIRWHGNFGLYHPIADE